MYKCNYVAHVYIYVHIFVCDYTYTYLCVSHCTNIFKKWKKIKVIERKKNKIEKGKERQRD